MTCELKTSTGGSDLYKQDKAEQKILVKVFTGSLDYGAGKASSRTERVAAENLEDDSMSLSTDAAAPSSLHKILTFLA